ncbi:MAG: hypothetical protein A2Z18_03380 [Armatimonadetes bacterium RBG_16_58_9]|nr:MAG: hypothetical protein A2Z18_03380 [Armatimonadetes bacterium RBG_16_58_9]
MTVKADQCRRNILDLLCHLRAPDAIHVLQSMEDRIFVALSQEFIDWVLTCCDEHGDLRFSRAILSTRAHPGVLKCWRETVTLCSLQICLHEDKIELDIDIGGVRTDAVGVLVHAWEVLWNRLRRRRTDPFAVRRLLESRRGVTVMSAAEEAV